MNVKRIANGTTCVCVCVCLCVLRACVKNIANGKRHSHIAGLHTHLLSSSPRSGSTRGAGVLAATRLPPSPSYHPVLVLARCILLRLWLVLAILLRQRWRSGLLSSIIASIALESSGPLIIVLRATPYLSQATRPNFALLQGGGSKVGVARLVLAGRVRGGGRAKTCCAACVDKGAILGLDPVFFLTVSTCCGLTLFAASSLVAAFVIPSLCFSRSSFSRSFCVPGAPTSAAHRPTRIRSVIGRGKTKRERQIRSVH